MKKTKIINEERQFLFDELFFSTTDLTGRISSWNTVFQKISGYSAEEMIDKPHSIIRHPDMPRAVFKLLWDTIQSGKVVGAYVKNLAKDGRYYWVYALVLPINGAYLSIRLKPSSDYFEIVKAAYRDLLEWEQKEEESGKGKAEVAEESKQILLGRLASLGFDSYDSFMYASFPAEIIARDQKQEEKSDLTHSSSSLGIELGKVKSDLNLLFGDLYRAIDLSMLVKDNFAQMQTLAGSIRIGALNALIEAARMGNNGETLFVLANYLGSNGTTTITELGIAEKASHRSLKDVGEILFFVCCAKLQTEILTNFLDELEQGAREDQTESPMRTDRIAVLLSSFSGGIAQMMKRYSGLQASFSSVLGLLEEIRRLFMGLKIAHVAAKAEASRMVEADRFGQVFDDVCSVVDQGRDLIEKTAWELESYLQVLKGKSELSQSIARVASEVSETKTAV